MVVTVTYRTEAYFSHTLDVSEEDYAFLQGVAELKKEHHLYQELTKHPEVDEIEDNLKEITVELWR